MMRRRPISGSESIWEYPQTPVVRPASRRIRVLHRKTPIADTSRSRRVCEMGHAPAYYIPPEDVRLELLEPNDNNYFCNWKGIALYFDLYIGGEVIADAAWCYPEPTRSYSEIRDFISFYPERIDRCMVGQEEAGPEPNREFGGWVTSHIEGPFR